MSLQPKTLGELNTLFGTQAKAHARDPRLLIGASIADKRLAFVPGVKAVLTPGVLTKQNESAIDPYRKAVADSFAGCATPLSDQRMVVHGNSTADWHFDARPKGSDIAELPELNAQVIDLSCVKGRGTLYQIGALDDAHTGYDWSYPHLWGPPDYGEMNPGDSITFTTTYPARDFSAIAASVYALFHAGQKGRGRVIIRDQYRRDGNASVYYAPAR